jgi:hypothetical protein
MDEESFEWDIEISCRADQLIQNNSMPIGARKNASKFCQGGEQ